MKFDMKFKSHVLLITLISICLTGCWDREYLKDLHLAYCAAIDYTENGEVKETIELIIPPDIEQSATKNEIHSSFGPTVRNASDQLRNKVRGNIRFIKYGFELMGRTTAEKGLYPILDVNYRDPSNPTSNVRLIITEGEASQILEQKKVGELQIGEFLKQKIDSLEEMSIFPKETADTVFRSLMDPGHDFALPYLGRDGSEIITKGVALFHDQNYSGMLNPDQSIMMVLLMGKQGKNARFTKKLDLGHSDDIRNFITINVGSKKIKRQFKVTIADDESIDVNLGLELQAVVEEFTDVLDEKELKKVSQDLSDLLTKEAKTVVNEIQKANCDIFGVGRKLIAYHHNVWSNKNWSEDYRKVKFHTKVDVKIVSTGILQ
ncbi:Ger(x)C family spore germination protein [Paenibacillus sp. B2(2019)]|uniref:Ger(x)C family spore germination protein n=1 Tax=Paenibacillus sp. B2(2019) TaxID=2607754 RepID=UPI0011F23715|nr:Ger(x)C family spore germination protein [Paenibacillus sp. B2(2019)]KAA1187837.1 Ger(x)C family spore germination protein [Paenibacillus sp. B2(2019)]